MNDKIKRRYLIILIVLPLILKLILAFTIPGHMAVEGLSEHGDIDTFKRIADAMIEGKNLYEVEVILPYGPLAYLFYMVNGIIAIKTGLPFYFVIKILPILAECLISLILFMILNKKYNLKKSFYWSLIFALNPASIAATAIHGQLDAIPILAMVLSYYFFTSNNKKIRNILPAICLSFGASFKFYPLYLLPVLFFKYKTIKEKLSFVLIAIVSFLMAYISVIISGDFFIAIKKIFGFTPLFMWGIAKFFLLLHRFNISSSPIVLVENFLINYGKVFLGVALIITVLISRKMSLDKSYKLFFYCIYVFSFYLHPHHLTWIIPFLFIKINFKEILYLIPVIGHMYFLYIINLIGIGLGVNIGNNALFSALSFIFGVLVWFFCIYMYFKYIKEGIKKIEFKRIFSISYWLK